MTKILGVVLPVLHHYGQSHLSFSVAIWVSMTL
jgi:hypothetical protein